MWEVRSVVDVVDAIFAGESSNFDWMGLLLDIGTEGKQRGVENLIGEGFATEG